MHYILGPYLQFEQSAAKNWVCFLLEEGKIQRYTLTYPYQANKHQWVLESNSEAQAIHALYCPAEKRPLFLIQKAGLLLRSLPHPQTQAFTTLMRATPTPNELKWPVDHLHVIARGQQALPHGLTPIRLPAQAHPSLTKRHEQYWEQSLRRLPVLQPALERPQALQGLTLSHAIEALSHLPTYWVRTPPKTPKAFRQYFYRDSSQHWCLSIKWSRELTTLRLKPQEDAALTQFLDSLEAARGKELVGSGILNISSLLPEKCYQHALERISGLSLGQRKHIEAVLEAGDSWPLEAQDTRESQRGLMKALWGRVSEVHLPIQHLERISALLTLFKPDNLIAIERYDRFYHYPSYNPIPKQASLSTLHTFIHLLLNWSSYALNVKSGGLLIPLVPFCAQLKVNSTLDERNEGQLNAMEEGFYNWLIEDKCYWHKQNISALESMLMVMKKELENAKPSLIQSQLVLHFAKTNEVGLEQAWIIMAQKLRQKVEGLHAADALLRRMCHVHHLDETKVDEVLQAAKTPEKWLLVVSRFPSSFELILSHQISKQMFQSLSFKSYHQTLFYLDEISSDLSQRFVNASSLRLASLCKDFSSINSMLYGLKQELSIKLLHHLIPTMKAFDCLAQVILYRYQKMTPSFRIQMSQQFRAPLQAYLEQLEKDKMDTLVIELDDMALLDTLFEINDDFVYTLLKGLDYHDLFTDLSPVCRKDLCVLLRPFVDHIFIYNYQFCDLLKDKDAQFMNALVDYIQLQPMSLGLLINILKLSQFEVETQRALLEKTNRASLRFTSFAQLSSMLIVLPDKSKTEVLNALTPSQWGAIVNDKYAFMLLCKSHPQIRSQQEFLRRGAEHLCLSDLPEMRRCFGALVFVQVLRNLTEAGLGSHFQERHLASLPNHLRYRTIRLWVDLSLYYHACEQRGFSFFDNEVRRTVLRLQWSLVKGEVVLEGEGVPRALRSFAQEVRRVVLDGEGLAGRLQASRVH